MHRLKSYNFRHLVFWQSLLVLLICFQAAIGQDTYLRFRHLKQENGLTNSSIHSITQDKYGYIWIGTEGGLFRYDGYRFRLFSQNPNDTNSLNSNVVFALMVGSDNKLWIGTYGGLMIYDQTLEKFTDLNLSKRYMPGQTIPVNDIVLSPDSLIYIGCQEIGLVVYDPVRQSFDDARAGRINRYLQNNTINSILFDSEGNCWIGTFSSGVYKFIPGLNQPVHYNFEPFSKGKLNCNEVLKIVETKNNDIWITTRGGGVFKLGKGKDVINHYIHNSPDAGSIGSNETYDIWEDHSGKIWISTNGGGLNIYDHETNRFIRVKHKPNDKYSLLNDNIRSLFEDRQGNIWLTSFQSGMNIHVNSPYQFNHFYFPPEEKTEYRSTTVLSFYTDKGDLWVGTDGGGLKKINRKTGSVTTFLPGHVNNSIPDRVVMTIHKDLQGNMWLGTYLSGLVKYVPSTGKFNNFLYEPGNKKSISSNYVTCLLEDRKGNFWIGTNGGGLNLLNKSDNSFTHFKTSESEPENSLVNNYITVMQEDINGDLWLGTYWGLSHFSVSDSSFRNYLNSHEKPGSLSNNVVLSILRDSRDRLWVGTRMGLNLYDRGNDNFLIFTENDGLAGNTINGILEDSKGNIWISTNRGLSKFNPISGRSINFYAEDGLQGNEFYHGACFKSGDGEMFFGGYNGFNSFYPDSIEERHYEPNVIFTALRVLDNEIPIGIMPDGRTILDKSITETKNINLRYSDKSISLYFASFDLIEGSKIVYAYILEGFDNNWKYTTQEHPFATYTNLSPGNYTFIVKAGKTEIIDKIEKDRRIHIYIKPPVWRTWWAYLIYFVLLVYIVYYFWSLSIQRLKEKNQIKLEKMKREQVESVTQARMSFYTNISHDIRTPLTLIIGPLEQLLGRGKEVEPYRKQLDIMLKNARRLLRLINQLLDFRKIEMQKMKLNAEEADLVKFIRDIVYSFEEFAVEKQIDFKFKSQIDSFTIWFDTDKVDKAMFNLLSNAFKYTPEKGKITVELKLPVKLAEKNNHEFAEISITDTGKGIAALEINKIFERFYQGHNKHDASQGWGLGLNLSKNYIELHQGDIKVESIEKAGSVFKIYLPLDDSYLSDEERIITTEPGLNKYIHLSAEAYKTTSDSSKKQGKIRQSAVQVLIVEDNIDLRDYLADELGMFYSCFEANNGQEGYELAIDIMPDLVVSDVMMPGMNGYQLCRNLKENIITSHIPVVLLTAKNTVDDQIEGLESGADAYISKPFRPDQLIATIDSIIENRLRLKEKFGSLKDFTKRPVQNTSDDKFLNKANEAIMTNLTNHQFGVIELASELNMSRVHLHRKMKAIADIGPNELIRKIRLQKAAELLLQNEYTIADICSLVGFSSTTYFSSCFKNYFKLTPKEFVDKGK